MEIAKKNVHKIRQSASASTFSGLVVMLQFWTLKNFKNAILFLSLLYLLILLFLDKTALSAVSFSFVAL